MAEYIDKDLLLNKLSSDETLKHARNLIKLYIEEQPTADMREVRRGKWIENEDGLHECSYCHKKIHYVDWDQPIFTEFCHGCGAEMEVE